MSDDLFDNIMKHIIIGCGVVILVLGGLAVLGILGYIQ